MNASLSKIIELVNGKNYAKAEIEIKPLLSNDPDSFDLNKILGIALLAQRKYNGALSCFEKCMNVKDNDFDVLLNISYLFLKVQNLDYAIDFSNKALKIKPDMPGAYQNIGHAYHLMQRFDLAKENIEKSIDLRGGINSQYFYDLPELVNLYAEILLALSEKKKFSTFVKEALRKIYNSSLLLKLLRNDRSDIDPIYIDKTNNMIQNMKSNPNIAERNSHISSGHFFLAEYFAKTDKKKSEENYILANKYIADMQRESLYDRQKFYFNMIKIFKDFDENNIKKFIDPDKGDGLIFIIGMPRSGTTLTESIVSTATDVIAGGEKTFFPIQLNDTVRSFNDETDLSPEFFEDLGSRYLEYIKSHRNGVKNFIDKLPENHLFYKFIKLSLPKAKFIHCFRDPWDNAISLFKQNYSINVNYASSFFGIANEIANYEYLTKFWKSLDGEKALLDVKYEEIIQDKSKIVDKIWEFCQLSGSYSDEKRKSHFGRTASMQQVTKDIYKTSLKKSDFQEFSHSFYEDLTNQANYLKDKIGVL